MCKYFIIILELFITIIVIEVLCNDAVSDSMYAAVRDVHEHLDDNKDGKINTKETAEYVETELKEASKTKQLSFHREDSEISVDELWLKWKSSEVFVWTEDDVIEWLVSIVKLPEYESVFRKHKVNGQYMPRLATPKANFVHKELSINDATHRKKIYLKASDVLLFGIPEGMTKKKNANSDKNFLAIQAVHAHLDDDSDGIIDIEETTEYVRDELESDSDRQAVLHGKDAFISVEELWDAWIHSEVHNWTTDQVVYWLKTTVALPQYEAAFREKNIDGKLIPRIATEKSGFLQKELGVLDPKHRRKIYLRASDVILFGTPDVQENYVKDMIVLLLVILSTLACLYAVNEKKRTRRELEQMSKDMEQLQQAEIKLKELQSSNESSSDISAEEMVSFDKREQALLEEIETAKNEADRLRDERSKNQEDKIKLSLVEQELSEVRMALAKAELELSCVKFKSPSALQGWLKMTYQKEQKYFQYRKQLALMQMEEAKDACDKISKTRRSMFGSLRLAHGQSIDVVDQKILSAKAALAEVTTDLQERQNRWRNIESICGFGISGSTTSVATPALNKSFNRQSIIDSVKDLPVTLSRPTEGPLFYCNGDSSLDTDKYMEPIFTAESGIASNGVLRRRETNNAGERNPLKRFSPSFDANMGDIPEAHVDEPVTLKMMEDRSRSASPVNHLNNVDGKTSPTTEVLEETPIPCNGTRDSTFPRSFSERIMPFRPPEKRISRTLTEPNNIVVMGMTNEFTYKKLSSSKSNGRLPSQSSYDSQRSRSTDNLHCSFDNGSSEANSSSFQTNSDDCEDIQYMSDESVGSLQGISNKKSKKGLRGLFSRRSKFAKEKS